MLRQTNCRHGRVKHRSRHQTTGKHPASVPVQGNVTTRFATASVRVRHLLRSCGTCGGQCSNEGNFLRILRTSVSVAKHSTDCSTFIHGWFSRPFSGSSNSGLGCTPDACRIVTSAYDIKEVKLSLCLPTQMPCNEEVLR
jgi:hypothetical protein